MGLMVLDRDLRADVQIDSVELHVVVISCD
jgi:hypothetical protein